MSGETKNRLIFPRESNSYSTYLKMETVKTKSFDFRLNPYQYRFFMSEAKRLAYYGEFRSGKTMVAGLKMLKLREEAESELLADITRESLPVFPLVMFAENLHSGFHTLIQGFGVGPLRANLIILDWFENIDSGIFSFKEIKLGRNLRTALAAQGGSACRADRHN